MPQLNASAENRSQILYQFPEVHTAFSGKVEEQFAVVKRAFHIDQAHFQVAQFDLFFANLKGAGFFFAVVLQNAQIFFGCLAQNGLQRCRYFFFGYLLVGNCHFSAFCTMRRFCNDKIAHF